jgi:hypothetical protein
MPGWGRHEWACWRLSNEVIRILYLHRPKPVSVEAVEKQLNVRPGGLRKLHEWRGYGILRLFSELAKRGGEWQLSLKDDQLPLVSIAFGEKLPTEPAVAEDDNEVFRILSYEQWTAVSHAGRRVITDRGEQWESFYGSWRCRQSGRNIGPAELLSTRVRIPRFDEP